MLYLNANHQLKAQVYGLYDVELRFCIDSKEEIFAYQKLFVSNQYLNKLGPYFINTPYQKTLLEKQTHQMRLKFSM